LETEQKSASQSDQSETFAVANSSFEAQHGASCHDSDTSIIEMNELTYKSEEEEEEKEKEEERKPTCGFAMDRRAIVDDVFLLVGRNRDYKAFEKLLVDVQRATKKYRRKTLRPYNKMKSVIIENIKKKNYGTEHSITVVDLTRKVRNIIMHGTTIFTLSPSAANEQLILVAKGLWSGGAFLPCSEEHKALSNAANQHYTISFSMKNQKNQLMIERTHEFRYSTSTDEAFKISETLEFVCNRKSLMKVL